MKYWEIKSKTSNNFRKNTDLFCFFFKKKTHLTYKVRDIQFSANRLCIKCDIKKKCFLNVKKYCIQTNLNKSVCPHKTQPAAGIEIFEYANTRLYSRVSENFGVIIQSRASRFSSPILCFSNSAARFR